MAKTRAAAERARIASSINKFAGTLATARAQWRWIAQAVEDARKFDIEIGMADFENISFKLAQDIASGRVVLTLPDEPRPLFDRPQVSTEEPAKVPPAKVAPVEAIGPPGTPCVQCNRCHRLRLVAGPCCPHCRNPEYGLVTIGMEGTIISGWPEKRNPNSSRSRRCSSRSKRCSRPIPKTSRPSKRNKTTNT